MDQDAFRDFYSATARPLWAYIQSVVGISAVTDDLLQDSYLRPLTANLSPSMSPAHRRHYLFRVASHLIADYYRSRHRREVPIDEQAPKTESSDSAATKDLAERALKMVLPRDRQLVWLAYVEGASHKEIAATMGYKVASVAPLLSKASRRMMGVVRKLLQGGSK
jgi:RNA polymerase sigma-70 factor (ECF subfamily)